MCPGKGESMSLDNLCMTRKLEGRMNSLPREFQLCAAVSISLLRSHEA